MATLERQEPRTVEIGLRPAQMNVFRCDKRFRVLVAGRRFGKTHLALVELLRAAWGKRSNGLVHRAQLSSGKANRMGSVEAVNGTLLERKAERNRPEH